MCNLKEILEDLFFFPSSQVQAVNLFYRGKNNSKKTGDKMFWLTLAFLWQQTKLCSFWCETVNFSLKEHVYAHFPCGQSMHAVTWTKDFSFSILRASLLILQLRKKEIMITKFATDLELFKVIKKIIKANWGIGRLKALSKQ